MIPPGRHGGRRRSVNVREVLNGWTGCQWKALPKDLPPKSTVHGYFDLWDWDGTLASVHDALYVAVREQEGREASPTVAVIDSQSAKGAQNVWPAPSASGFGDLTWAVCINVSGLRVEPWPRWRSARPGPHKGAGIECHFAP